MNLPMVFLANGASIRDSLEAIQNGGGNISLAIDDEGTLAGIVTDGDIRRALLAGRGLKDPIEDYIQRAPFTVGPNDSRTYVLDLMQARGLSQVPIVESSGLLVGLHLLRELLGQSARPNIAVILAGGRGTRLLPITNEIPKPMIEIAGRPILERIVTHLVGFGVQQIAIAVGYLHEQIEEYFGNGERFGCQIRYIREVPTMPLGTGGPLGLLKDTYPEVSAPILILNGDLVTQFNVAGLLENHEASGAAITIGVVTYTHEVPFGVLATGDDGLVISISEKPILEKTVSAGIYACDPGLLQYVPREEFFPMTNLIEDCLSRSAKVSTWYCDNEWSDIGHPQDLARAQGKA